MTSRFTDISTREQCIIGLTDIIVRIFKIPDDTKKLEIYTGLKVLDDDTLLERKSAIEAYLTKIHQLDIAFQNKVMYIEHTLREKEERESLQLIINL